MVINALEDKQLIFNAKTGTLNWTLYKIIYSSLV